MHSGDGFDDGAIHRLDHHNRVESGLGDDYCSRLDNTGHDLGTRYGV